MPNRLSKEDVDDLDLVDSYELISDGSVTATYRAGIAISQTIAVSRTVVLVSGGIDYGDEQVEVGDLLVIAGSAAAGIYHVESIVDSDNLTVVEAIPDTVGGTASFRHPVGASKVGVDPTDIVGVTSNILQTALEELSLLTDDILTDDVEGDCIVDDVTGHVMRDQ